MKLLMPTKRHGFVQLHIPADDGLYAMSQLAYEDQGRPLARAVECRA